MDQNEKWYEYLGKLAEHIKTTNPHGSARLKRFVEDIKVVAEFNKTTPFPDDNLNLMQRILLGIALAGYLSLK